MKESETNFSNQLGIISKQLHKTDKLSRKKAFDKVNKSELRRMIQKRPLRMVGKNLSKEWMLRSSIRTIDAG